MNTCSNLLSLAYLNVNPDIFIAQLAGTVEYTKCFSAEDPANNCSGYETKQSDGEVLVMLKLWGMRSTPLLPSFRGSF